MPLQKSNARVTQQTKVYLITLLKNKLLRAFNARVIQRTKVHKISNKKKKVPSNGKFKVYLESWYKFCDDCTVSGYLHLIAGYSSRLSIKNRIAILLYFLIICGIMVYLCQNNVKTYLSFKSKTATTYNFRNNLTFPTISLSNENRFQRSYVGGSTALISFLTLYMIISMDNALSHFNDFIFLNEKTCATNSTLGCTYDQNFDFDNVFSKVVMNSSLSIIRCWWEGLEIENCTSEFSEWKGDDRFGISFNTQNDPDKVKEGFTLKTAVTSESNSGLHLLMNVRQDEYCGIDTVPSGAGFRLMLYNYFNRQPSTVLYPSISLGPGYSYEISIQPVTFNRQQLEWLGYCRSSIENSWVTDVVYDPIACFGLCVADKIFYECDCLYFWLPLSQKTADYYKKNLSQLTYCVDLTSSTSSNALCMFGQLNKYFRESPSAYCPQCKQPCQETLYSYQLTSTKLILNKVNKLLNFSRNVTDEEIKKNILQVKIYFGDLTEVIVTESLDFTSLDLFISMGNNIILFIGISTLSLFEIIYQIIYSFHVSILKVESVWMKKVIKAVRERVRSKVSKCKFLHKRSLKL